MYSFQSTLPVRGATPARLRPFKGHSHFNPRSPCGERPPSCTVTCIVRDFNPRSPCGERLPPGDRQPLGSVISIHAPRAGSDWTNANSTHYNRHFNPRSPCGERQLARLCPEGDIAFQSTLPVRGATRVQRRNCTVLPLFQSTLPVRGATVKTRIIIRIFK